MDKNKIMEDIVKDSCLNKWVNVNVKGTDKDDFRSHIWMIILERPQDWFESRKSMTASVIAIMRNQNRRTSPYWKIYKTYENGDTIVPDKIDDPGEDNDVLNILGDYVDDELYRTLKPERWIQFKLHFHNGLKLKDIAKRTGFSYQSVRLNIKSVLVKLEERMPKEVKQQYEQRIQKKRNESS